MADENNDKKSAAEELKEQGNKSFAAKDFDKAIELYTQGIKIDPNNHILYSNRSASYGGKSNWELASTDAKECIRLDPSFIKGYYRLATAQIELKEYDGAISTIRQGLTIDNNNTQLMKQLRTVKALKNKQQQMEENAAKNAAAATSAQQQPNTILDSVTSKELQDLQLQYGQTNREYNTTQANVVKMQRECKLYEITKEELIENTTPDTNCYQSVGKIFLKSTRDDSIAQLEKNIEVEQKKLKDTTSKAEYLERKLKLQQQNIQELIQQNTK